MLKNLKVGDVLQEKNYSTGNMNENAYDKLKFIEEINFYFEQRFSDFIKAYYIKKPADFDPSFLESKIKNVDDKFFEGLKEKNRKRGEMYINILTSILESILLGNYTPQRSIFKCFG